MAKAEEAKGGSHRATYSADKRKGGYMIRVQGPNAGAFVGREVPVFQKGNDTPHKEKLKRLVWSGNDDGVVSGYVGPCALYEFEPRPRDKADEIVF